MYNQNFQSHFDPRSPEALSDEDEDHLIMHHEDYTFDDDDEQNRNSRKKFNILKILRKLKYEDIIKRKVKRYCKVKE